MSGQSTIAEGCSEGYTQGRWDVRITQVFQYLSIRVRSIDSNHIADYTQIRFEGVVNEQVRVGIEVSGGV